MPGMGGGLWSCAPPFVPNMVITHFASQGAEFQGPLVLDLVRPEFGAYPVSVVYVMCTRVCDSSQLYLLRPLYTPEQRDAEFPALLSSLYPPQDLLAFYYDIEHPGATYMERERFLATRHQIRQELLNGRTRAVRAMPRCSHCKACRSRFEQVCPKCEKPYVG